MKTPKPVKSFKHKDAKRAHIPSAEEAGYEAGSPKVKEAGAIELPFNPVITRSQDPELLWMHKYATDEKLTAQLDELQAKLKAGAFRKNTTVNYSFGGETFHPGDNACWKTTVQGLDRLAASRRIQKAGGTLRYKRYLEDFPAVEVTNLWDDVAGAADKAYVVPTSTSVVERCLLMTTDPGDLVLDPTCGSGTTAYVAEQWGRRWITTDTSRIAVNIAKTRLMTATFPYYLLYDSEEGQRYALGSARAPRAAVGAPADRSGARDTAEEFPAGPRETTREGARAPQCDLGQGFIYKKVPHVTLGSIANNEPPDEETLYDQPLEDKKRLRVAGPFTVETLQSYEPISPEELARQRTEDKELGNFEDLIFAHLKSAGVKTGVKEENAVFVRIDRLAHSALHAEGWYMAEAGALTVSVRSTPKIGDIQLSDSASQIPAAADRDRPRSIEKKAYLHIGPKFGTVSKPAVTEAIKACRDKRDGDWLLILGFAFESGITELSRSFGNFQVSIIGKSPSASSASLVKRRRRFWNQNRIARSAKTIWLVTSRTFPAV